MRSSFAFVLIVSLIGAGGYFYTVAASVCAIPLAYRIGTIDEGFKLTEAEAQEAIAAAAAVWETATGKDLFQYDPEADFAINFIFDERQAMADAESALQEQLNATKETNEEIAEEYESLRASYEAKKATYESAIAAYQSRLEAYNAKVDQYNRAGGAPKDAYQALADEQISLREAQNELNQFARDLNRLVSDINRLGEAGNAIVDSYNRDVAVYNQAFGHVREFTQGDYQGDFINIYTFTDARELALVLTHELGHALNLGHVEDEAAIMHFLIEEQPETVKLTAADLTEFERVCSDTPQSFMTRLKIALGVY